MSRHVYVVLWLLMYVASRSSAAEAPADFGRFWRQAFVQLQSRPANASWQADTVTFATPATGSCRLQIHVAPDAKLPPVVYLLDRAETGLAPTHTYSWLIVDVGAMWHDADLGPEPTHHPMYAAVLAARRGLDLLLARTAPGHTRAGLVGEGRGGGVALALAALAPDDVAFVAAHEPLPGPRYGDAMIGVGASPELQRVESRYHAFRKALPTCLAYFDLSRFVGDIRCPALLSYGGRDEVVSPAEVTALYEALPGDKELAEFPRAGHCQAGDLKEWWETWRAWASEKVGM